MTPTFDAHIQLVLARHFDHITIPESGRKPEHNVAILLASAKAFGQLHRHIRKKKVDANIRLAMRKYAQDAVQMRVFQFYVKPVNKNPRYKG